MLEKLINDADRVATEQYVTRHIPKCITTNTCKVDVEHFKKFQNKFLTKKKNLEINVIRDNKRQEMLNEIFDESTFAQRRRKINQNIAKKVIEAGKHFLVLENMMNKRKVEKE